MMTIDQLKPFFDWLYLHPNLAGFAVFLISLAESLAVVGLLIPGSVMMTAIGGLIGSGILPATVTLLWAMLGAIAGDNASYWLGYRYHDHIRQFWPFRRYPKLLENGTRFFKQHGSKSVFLGRFVGPVRPMIPLIAGMMNMPPLQFMLANIGSAIAWAPAYMLPGILLGAASAEIAPQTATHILFFVVIALLAFWCVSWLLKRLCLTVLTTIDYLIKRCWDFMQKKTALRPLYQLLRNPDDAADHSQLSLVFGAIITGSLFGFLACSVMHKGLLTQFDSPVFHLLRSLHTPAITEIMIGITFIGQAHVIAALVIGVAAWLLYQRDGLSVSHWLGLSLSCYALAELFKNLLHITRPGDLIHSPGSWSFPSGHATLTGGILGFFAVLLALHLKPNWRRLPFIAASIVIISVMLSRIYLGAHWLSDVVGGILLGLFCCILATISYRYLLSRCSSKRKPVFSPIAVILVALLSLTAGWLWYFGKHFHQAIYSYTPYAPQKMLALDSWWEHGDQQAPLYRKNRIGKPVQILNIQWAGDLNSIDDELEQNGWLPLPKTNLAEILNHLAGGTNPTHTFPLLNHFYQDKKPLLTLIKPLEKEKALLVLRLWDDQTLLNQRRLPLWIGTVSYYHPWRLALLHNRMAQSKFTPHLLPAQQVLTADLSSYEYRQIAYPYLDNLNTHENSDWQGYILLIRPKNQP